MACKDQKVEKISRQLSSLKGAQKSILYCKISDIPSNYLTHKGLFKAAYCGDTPLKFLDI